METQPVQSGHGRLQPVLPLLDEFDTIENEESVEIEEDSKSFASLSLYESIDNLIPDEESYSFYFSFLRHLHYTHFLSRFSLWGIRPASVISLPTQETENKKSARLCWLTGEGIPLENWSKISRVNFITDFFNTVYFMVADVTPTLLAGLLLHDLICYGIFPEERCGDSLATILAGTAHNQISWGQHFGSDILHEPAYWSWLSLVILPPIFGLMSAQLHHHRQRKILHHLDEQEILAQLSMLLTILDKEALSFKDALMTLWPFSSINTALARIQCMVIWEGRYNTDGKLLISINLKKALIGNLIELILPSNYFLIRYQATKLLAKIVASFHPKNLDRFIIDPIHKGELLQLRREILRAFRVKPKSQNLIEITQIDISESTPLHGYKNDPLNSLTRYFLWTLGEENHLLTQLYWIPSILISGILSYFLFREFEIIVLKINDIIDHFTKQTACQNKGFFFKFRLQNEYYECVACDWPFVNYKNSFSAQTCLTSLLQQTMDPKTLRDYILQLPKRQNISYLDLSYQDWPSWTTQEWEQVLTALQASILSPLKLLNVSGAMIEDDDVVVRASSPTQSQVEILTHWLMNVTVIQFDIRNRWLKDEQLSLLLTPLSHKQFEAIYLINTNLTDQGAYFLSKILDKNLTKLSFLSLEDNQITDLGVAHISQALNNSLLEKITIANNPFSDLGLQELADGIKVSSLHTLDLSGHRFSNNSLRYFSDTIQKSSLKTLILKYSDLSSDDLHSLQTCLQNLETLDLSNNLLVDQDLIFLFKVLTKSHLQTLRIAHNEFTTQATDLIAAGLPTTMVQDLDFSGNFLTQAGFTKLVSAFPLSNLLHFSCEQCQLDDEKMEQLIEVFIQMNVKLTSLNLNKNQITELTLLKLLHAISHTNLTILSLNNNAISATHQNISFINSLSKMPLESLDLGGNALNTNFFNQLARALPETSLQELNLADNMKKVTPERFAETLINVPCHIDDIKKEKLSRQDARIIYSSQPNTKLKKLNVLNTEFDESTTRGLCRVESSSANLDLLFLNSPLKFNWITCEPIFSLPKSSIVRRNILSVNQVVVSDSSLAHLSYIILLFFIGLIYKAYYAGQSSYRFFHSVPKDETNQSELYINNSTQRPSSL